MDSSKVGSHRPTDSQSEWLQFVKDSFASRFASRPLLQLAVPETSPAVENAGKQSPQPTPRRLCIMCGWVHSSPSILRKYAPLYSTRGFFVIQWARGGKWLQNPDRDTVEDVKDLLAFIQSVLVPQSLVFHAFSNGGVSYLTHFLRAFETSPEFSITAEMVRGVVFDSAPCYMTPHVAASAMTANQIGKWYRPFVSFVVYQMSALGWFLSRLRGFSHLTYADKYWRWDFMRKGKIMQQTPTLFLYSDADDLCSVPFVETVAAELAIHNPHVHTFQFTGSDHVAHYRTHPELYASKVERFLELYAPEHSFPVFAWKNAELGTEITALPNQPQSDDEFAIPAFAT